MDVGNSFARVSVLFRFLCPSGYAGPAEEPAAADGKGARTSGLLVSDEARRRCLGR